jgi:hypothetical protein
MISPRLGTMILKDGKHASNSSKLQDSLVI